MAEIVLGFIIDTIASWARIFAALALAILLAWIAGIATARNSHAEKILVPIFDVLQAVPVLGFLPVILVVFVSYFPPSLGVELAVVFLIFSGLGWSMAFAVYEAVSSIPKDIMEVAELEKMGLWTKITQIYIPASWSKVAYNSSIFWSAAVFYLASSEIFSLGNANYSVSHGLGADLAILSLGGRWGDYAVAIFILIAAVALTRFFFLGEFSVWSEKFKLVEEPRSIRNDPIYRFYARVDREFHAKVLRRVSRVQLRLPRTRASSLRRLSHQSSRIPLILLALLIALIVGIGYALLFPLMGRFPSGGSLALDEVAVIAALLYSTIRVWGVYLFSVVIGFPLGITVGLNGKLFSAASPILQVVSSIPAPVFLPGAVILLAGVPFKGEIVAELVIFLGMIWYIAFNVMQGVRSIPSDVWEVVRLSRMKTRMVWRNIVLPASLPSFVTGSITAVGGGWSVLIVAEYFQVATGSTTTVVTQVSNGIGKLLSLAAINGDYASMALALVSMTVLIVLVDRMFWRRLYRWTTSRFTYNR